MTGYESDALTIAYQSGYYDGKKAAQRALEPVAYYHPHKGFYWAKPTNIAAPTIVDVQPLALYTTPPQRAWVGLDDDELTEAWHWGGCDPHIEGAHFKALYQYFEAKLKDKNHVAQKTD